MASVLPTDPRRRSLLILAGVAAIALLLALLAVWHQSSTAENKEPVALFPGLARHVARRDVAHIHIQSKANGTLDIDFKPQTGWVIASRDDYPASFEQVNGTLVGLAAMQKIEPKTARPDMLSYIGLEAPPKGDGVLVTIKDEAGKTLAAMIAGKTIDIGDATGATGLFVRQPDSNQSWLVRSVAEIRSSATDWMEKNVISIDRSRIQSAEVKPPQGPAYAVRRDKPSDPDFKLTPIPPGREISDAATADGAASSIVGFSFDDANRASNFDFSKAAQLVTHTFDGLTITVNTIKKGEDFWATVSAEALPDKRMAAKEAREINARANGWAYKLAPFKGTQFTTPLENLLKPKGTPAKTAP